MPILYSVPLHLWPFWTNSAINVQNTFKPNEFTVILPKRTQKAFQSRLPFPQVHFLQRNGHIDSYSMILGIAKKWLPQIVVAADSKTTGKMCKKMAAFQCSHFCMRERADFSWYPSDPSFDLHFWVLSVSLGRSQSRQLEKHLAHHVPTQFRHTSQRLKIVGATVSLKCIS